MSNDEQAAGVEDAEMTRWVTDLMADDDEIWVGGEWRSVLTVTTRGDLL